MLSFTWGVIFMGIFIWSAIEPNDVFTWFLEVAPALIGAALVITTRKRFPLTPLLYSLILIHCIVLMIGGHYTYAEVPFFDGLFGAERNNYDKVGHFCQGFVPAILARELLIRLQIVSGPRWRTLFILSVTLAFSALYELIEWWVALFSGEDATAFLGTQGYEWDTQSDMGFALLGAVCALLLLAKWHDEQLATLR